MVYGLFGAAALIRQRALAAWIIAAN